MAVAWRFYVDDRGEWKWQQFGEDRRVLADSRGSYAAYDACVRNATSRGYVYAPSQPRLPRSATSHSV